MPALGYAGYWGVETATLDFCEPNYQFSHYISEFVNTISNLPFIVLAITGVCNCLAVGLQRRFVLNYILLAMVGLGSSLFHGTLLYEAQMLDELPMVYCLSLMVYIGALLNHPHISNRLLSFSLATGAFSFTYVYLFHLKNPIFHQIYFGILTVAASMLGGTTKGTWTFEEKMIQFGGFGLPLIGFVLWNIENVFCEQILGLQEFPALFPVLQLHAWWHILSSIGSYWHICFASLASARRRDPAAYLGWYKLMPIIPFVVVPKKLSRADSKFFDDRNWHDPIKEE